MLRPLFRRKHINYFISAPIEYVSTDRNMHCKKHKTRNITKLSIPVSTTGLRCKDGDASHSSLFHMILMLGIGTVQSLRRNLPSE